MTEVTQEMIERGYQALRAFRRADDGMGPHETYERRAVEAVLRAVVEPLVVRPVSVEQLEEILSSPDPNEGETS